jgi:methylenetetrahydrofolate dehydrogenase (NADP+)/methenyltetrahydrofolate cyclohydrolase
MLLLTAKPVAEKIRVEVKRRVHLFSQQFGRRPKLSVILVGDDNASQIYTQRKGELALQLGMDHETITFPKSVTPAEVRNRVQKLNQDSGVDGILIQRPLPKKFLEGDVLFWISPEKDVDAFHPQHAGELHLGLPTFEPCTPAGIMELLSHYQISIQGKLACVIGRSPIVGQPMAALLLKADATVIQCHSKTQDLRALARQADILIVAAGKAGLVDATYIKPGATVIDVGIHRTSDGKLTGDVQFEAVAKVASAISPVPGGVGPMTLSILMRNTIQAAEIRERARQHLS